MQADGAIRETALPRSPWGHREFIGLDRPLRTERDFARFSGQKARLKLRVPMEGQRNFVGVLRECAAGKVGLEVEGRILSIDLGNLDKARLRPAL